MPLKLVTGPANAAKAGEVLGGLRARLDDEPILVVPAFADVEHSQRELAERGAVFGARVVRFAWLYETIAERAGFAAAAVASDVQRELVVEQAVARARLTALSESAQRPGVPRALLRFVAELERSMVEPARFTAAVRRWAGDGPRRPYADEIAALYRLYRQGLEAAGLVDAELFAWRALDALRAEPARWRRTPLYVYGFDDFDPLQLDALETLSGRCEAAVAVSLPFEPGREAFRATAELHGRLYEIASERVALPPLDDHYADGSREALHHLERTLFEVEPARRPAGETVRLHSAGGERAEVELAGAEVLRLLRDGVAPGDVAVVLRRPTDAASLLEQVFGSYGTPYSLDRSVPLRQTGLGRGLLALLRCARPDLEGSADDLLTWLRTPGKLREAHVADRLEAEVRQSGVTDAAGARAILERDGRWSLAELDALARARDAGALLEALDRELARLFAGPYLRRAPVLSGAELDDARAFDAAHDALRELAAVLRADPGVRLDARRMHDTLAELPVRAGENPQPDRVQVTSPEAIRARRFEAVFVLGLQEGEFPRGGGPDPFLPDDDRRALALASGVALPLREDQLERERYLFYVCASRAERLLVLSSRLCDEEGDPEAESFFVEDVRELFDGIEVRRRSLSEVAWAPEQAPTAAELERSLAARGRRSEPRTPERLSSDALLEHLAAADAVSASALEKYADCPVKWLVESVLRPEALEPDPEQMVRGRYAHRVLERTFARLREETGERRVRPHNLERAEAILLEELEAHRADFRLAPDQTRVRAAVRRLEFDLLRFLGWEAEADGDFEPEHLELAFGGERPVEVADGVRVRGKVDRVDVCDGRAVVLDYKSGKRADSYKVASWERENRFQVALYMLAVREQLGLEPVGGVYEPLGARDKRQPRGLVAADVEELPSVYAGNDRLDADAFEAALDAARGRIVATARRMRAGELGCNPDRCAFDGGCSYPSICRAED